MNTNPPSTTFPAYADGDRVLVRVVGPGVCREGGRFENLLLDVERRHPRRLLLDLSECPRLDSTFAGAFLRLGERAQAGGFDVVIGGAHGAVLDLLDNLCLGDVFRTVDLPAPTSLERLDLADRDLTKEQVIALSLDGHERLAALNPENAARFASLLKVLRDQAPGGTAPVPARPDCSRPG